MLAAVQHGSLGGLGSFGASRLVSLRACKPAPATSLSLTAWL